MSKSKDILGTLFDSKAKVKILKFLFRNVGTSFSISDLADRVQETPTTVKKEINKFLEIGLIKVQK